ncbi:hypothetical protein [Spiroplasma endosymbiont of Virgichneumon dumeticola]|uniref:hypothetical protein n=1 Tax=Spiroplasma endosymbiont of Virgichneumon dumeticola TaxID=3139323 RepID=UPI0035C93281
MNHTVAVNFLSDFSPHVLVGRSPILNNGSIHILKYPSSKDLNTNINPIANKLPQLIKTNARPPIKSPVTKPNTSIPTTIKSQNNGDILTKIIVKSFYWCTTTK